MNLPSFNAQMLYAHVAWAVVLAACLVDALSWKYPLPRRLGIAWSLLALAVCTLSGRASPAYWLGLSLYLPSSLFVACCAMAIWSNTDEDAERSVLPTSLALGLALIGAVLYADTFGWLNIGLYARGFGGTAAIAALLVGGVGVVAIAYRHGHGAGWSLLGAVLLFALCRLPTGNAWDALLDPMLWLWSVFSLLTRAWSRWRCRARPVSTAITPMP